MMILIMNCILLCVFYCILLSAFVVQYTEYMKILCIRNIKFIPDHFQEQIKPIKQSLSSKGNRSSANQ
jgi:cell division protein FtsL